MLGKANFHPLFCPSAWLEAACDCYSGKQTCCPQANVKNFGMDRCLIHSSVNHGLKFMCLPYPLRYLVTLHGVDSWFSISQQVTVVNQTVSMFTPVTPNALAIFQSFLVLAGLVSPGLDYSSKRRLQPQRARASLIKTVK